jgi:hypothetical protein
VDPVLVVDHSAQLGPDDKANAVNGTAVLHANVRVLLDADVLDFEQKKEGRRHVKSELTFGP